MDLRFWNFKEQMADYSIATEERADTHS